MAIYPSLFVGSSEVLHMTYFFSVSFPMIPEAVDNITLCFLFFRKIRVIKEGVTLPLLCVLDSLNIRLYQQMCPNICVKLRLREFTVLLQLFKAGQSGSPKEMISIYKNLDLNCIGPIVLKGHTLVAQVMGSIYIHS